MGWMKAKLIAQAGLTALVAAGLQPAHTQPQTPNPPIAQKIPFVVKSPNGDRIDEYYWLRDDDAKAKRPEVMQYLEAENAYTAAVLAPLKGLQDQLFTEMRSRIREDDNSPPVFDHGWWTWRRFETGAEYPKLMRQRGSPERPDPKAPQEVMLDEVQLAAGKGYYAVAGTAVSPNGEWLAWAEDTAGRRIYTLRFKNLKTGRVLDEQVAGVLSDLVWAADNRTLFYLRQDPVTLQAEAVMRHRVGAAPGSDAEVYREKDKTLSTDIGASASHEYLIIEVGGYATTEILAVPAAVPGRAPRVVLARRDGVRVSADHMDGRWVMRTNEDAPNFRLVEARVPEQRRGWKELVPARDDVTLEGFALLKGRVAVQERVQGQPRVRLLGPGGKTLDADAATSVTLGDNPDPHAAYLRYAVASLIQPNAVYDLHLASGKSVLRKEQPVPGYDKSLYATERVWAPSRDGQRIPVTLAWRRDRARQDGTAPMYITGYGAYGYAMDVYFSSARVSLLDRGFVFAIAHIRGGADLGEAWYEDGRLMHKKNTFNDFVDATDYAVKARWAAKDKVFANGGSAGGLLMGVIANEAGDRYRGITLDVPFVDVITTMLDDTIPLTANEWTQWGDPHEKAAYDYMLSYSPYDNLAARPYPAMLVTTGLWDSQVQYYEPAKYVARLRARKTDHNPLLLQVNMEAGHGGASGRFQALKELAQEYAFFIDLAEERPAAPPPPRPGL
jgi:oligopeptidase B